MLLLPTSPESPCSPPKRVTHHSTICKPKRKINKLKKSLFGPPETAILNEWINEQIRQITECTQNLGKKYNFDFSEGEPLDTLETDSGSM